MNGGQRKGSNATAASWLAGGAVRPRRPRRVRLPGGFPGRRAARLSTRSSETSAPRRRRRTWVASPGPRRDDAFKAVRHGMLHGCDLSPHSRPQLWITSLGVTQNARCRPRPVPEALVRGVVTTGPVARAVKAGSCRYEHGEYRRCGAPAGGRCEPGVRGRITSSRHRPQPPRGPTGQAPKWTHTTGTPMVTRRGRPGRSAPCRSSGHPRAHPARTGSRGTRIGRIGRTERTSCGPFSGLRAQPAGMPPIDYRNAVHTAILHYFSASMPPEPATGMQPSPAGLPTAP